METFFTNDVTVANRANWANRGRHQNGVDNTVPSEKLSGSAGRLITKINRYAYVVKTLDQEVVTIGTEGAIGVTMPASE